MTATRILQGKMREKQFTLKSLANAMGLSTTALFNKVHNQREFLVSEVHFLCNALSLTEKEMEAIFFAASVE